MTREEIARSGTTATIFHLGSIAGIVLTCGVQFAGSCLGWRLDSGLLCVVLSGALWMWMMANIIGTRRRLREWGAS